MEEVEEVEEVKKEKRIVSSEQVLQYVPLVESYLRKSVKKNWNESNCSTRSGNDEVSLGNSGWTMADIRQYLMGEVFIALRNYDPTKNTKESTFVYGHLSKRVGSLMKKLTRPAKGYGKWSSNLEQVLGEIDLVE